MHIFENRLERRRGRVHARGEFIAIRVHVDDRALGDAAFHRGVRHGGRHGGDQARIEGCRDQVVRPVLQVMAGIRHVHFIGHVFARQ